MPRSRRPSNSPGDAATAVTLGDQLDASLRAVLPFLVNHNADVTTTITTRGDITGGGSGSSGSDEQLALGLVRSLRVNNHNKDLDKDGHPDDHMDTDSDPPFTPHFPPLALALVSSRHLPVHRVATRSHGSFGCC